MLSALMLIFTNILRIYESMCIYPSFFIYLLFKFFSYQVLCLLCMRIAKKLSPMYKRIYVCAYVYACAYIYEQHINLKVYHTSNTYKEHSFIHSFTIVYSNSWSIVSLEVLMSICCCCCYYSLILLLLLYFFHAQDFDGCKCSKFFTTFLSQSLCVYGAFTFIHSLICMCSYDRWYGKVFLLSLFDIIHVVVC